MKRYCNKTKDELISDLIISEREIAKLRSLHEPRHDTYACQRCGRRDSLDAVVDDKLWNQISPTGGHGGLLCLWCMDALCLEKGLHGTVQLHFPGWALISDEYKKGKNEEI